MTSPAAPASDLGDRLKALRQARGLSREEAAARGGTGFATLRSWESGRRTPRGPALDRLLRVVETPPRERAELLARHDEAYARVVLMDTPQGPPVDHGTLLRAFRLRNGWTQAEAARRTGVSQSAVAHWEAGNRLPEGPDLHAALFALGATGEEALAMLALPHAPSAGDDPLKVHDDIERIPGPLRETAMLANERSLWWRSMRDPELDRALLRATVQRAVWYAFHRRFGEVDALLRRIRRMAPDPNADSRSVGAAIVLADVRFRPNAPPLGLFRALADETASLARSPERAWTMGTRAVALATSGEARAIDLAERALEEAIGHDDLPVEAWFRRIDLAEVHLRLDDPERALDALGDDHLRFAYPAYASGTAPSGLSVRAHALIALGREPEPELMAALRGFAAKDGAPFYVAQLAAVERAQSARQ